VTCDLYLTCDERICTEAFHRGPADGRGAASKQTSTQVIVRALHITNGASSTLTVHKQRFCCVALHTVSRNVRD